MIDEMRDWSPEEAAALRALATVPPPADLEDRLVDALAARGLVRRRRPWLAWGLPAAAIALFVAGWAVGSRGPGGPLVPAGAPAPGTRYALLFYEGPAFDTLPSPEASGTLAAEYSEWARRARARGITVKGEELEPRGRSLGAESEAGGAFATREGDEVLGGFMIVEAASLEAAVELARTHPHVRHGGRIVVRPVVDH